jgi:hypothetical protein
MEIDLTDPSSFTLAAVRALIASKDDSRNRQLRVTKRGIAYLSDEVGNRNIDDLAFRFETWNAGNGYCGAKAASDAKWVKEVFDDLKENWPNPKSTYIDF